MDETTTSIIAIPLQCRTKQFIECVQPHRLDQFDICEIHSYFADAKLAPTEALERVRTELTLFFRSDNSRATIYYQP